MHPVATLAGAFNDPTMTIDPIEAELITSIDELLATEPTDEEGECPWCGAIRAPWAGVIRGEHQPECPWPRLGSAFAQWVQDGSAPTDD
jgi:hypothetical protein